MIINFKHKGLRIFYETGSTKGIQAAHAKKIRRILTSLTISTCAQDMNLPGFYLHSLEGVLKDHWSVRVNGNWRITFKFIGKDIELVDYQDYH